jgi:hypothetical protein
MQHPPRAGIQEAAPRIGLADAASEAEGFASQEADPRIGLADAAQEVR